MYCFAIPDLLESLEMIGNDNAQGEYYLTDCVAAIRSKGGRVAACIAADPQEAFGVNDRLQLAAAAKIAQGLINERHMRNGVSMLDPSLVWIGPDVRIEADVELLPMTFIYGGSTIGAGTVVGPSSRVNNSIVGRGCVIDESICVDAVLEDRVSTGPRAYLRPGTVLRTGTHAGTHVEIKNSDIGPGSKVPHLSYIGDAWLGAGVNIGAGSITCNYDGMRKSHTTIGDRAFIGSNTMFVAPVAVGSDATTGAGSVITSDVPDGALALERSKQTTIENWQDKRSAAGGRRAGGGGVPAACEESECR
jgi:bifunctional UDP-N-acetylglucosamine pyrophosphorylase/glucosamine-1-phosphate N-acetyltransferase